MNIIDVYLEQHRQYIDDQIKNGLERPMLLCGVPYGPETLCAQLIASRFLGVSLDALYAHPDIVFLGSDVDHRNRIDVDAVRECIARATRTPIKAKRQVVLIHHAERLTASAAHILLKALEEHRSHVAWILSTSSPEMIMDTIRSRCEEHVIPQFYATHPQLPFFQILADMELSSDVAAAVKASVEFWTLWNTGQARRSQLKECIVLWESIESHEYDPWSVHLDIGITTLTNDIRQFSESSTRLDFLSYLRHTLKNNANTPLIFESVICNMKTTSHTL